MILCLISFCVFSCLPFCGSSRTTNNSRCPRDNINVMEQNRFMENDVCLKRYHSHPFLVRLYRISSRGLLWKSCGGTLLDSTHVLTAGHCCEYPDQVAHTKIQEHQIESRSVIRMSKHNEYDFRKYYRDVCVMTLESAIYSGYSPYKSRFPKKSLTTLELEQMCPKGVITVWRALEMGGPILVIPQCADVKIISFQECLKRVVGDYTGIYDDNVCTLEEELCELETGGPLMCGAIQIGIASWEKDCLEKAPKIYTRVDQHLDFIWSYEVQSVRNGQNYRLKLDWWPYLFFMNLIFGILPSTVAG